MIYHWILPLCRTGLRKRLTRHITVHNHRGGVGLGFVEGPSVLQALVELAKEFAEQVTVWGGVAVAVHN